MQCVAQSLRVRFPVSNLEKKTNKQINNWPVSAYLGVGVERFDDGREAERPLEHRHDADRRADAAADASVVRRLRPHFLLRSQKRPVYIGRALFLWCWLASFWSIAISFENV